MQPRIMYIEDKSSGLSGPGRIGRVRFSKSGKSVYYAGRTFQTLKGRGFKADYFDVETGEEFWISGCKKRGGGSSVRRRDRDRRGCARGVLDFHSTHPAV